MNHGKPKEAWIKVERSGGTTTSTSVSIFINYSKVLCEYFFQTGYFVKSFNKFTSTLYIYGANFCQSQFSYIRYVCYNYYLKISPFKYHIIFYWLLFQKPSISHSEMFINKNIPRLYLVLRSLKGVEVLMHTQNSLGKKMESISCK